MIDSLNLASQPFRNRTLPWTLAAIVAAVSVVALALTLGQYRDVRGRSAAVEGQLRELRSEHATLRKQAEEVNSMLTEDQRRTLDAARLILDRKNFRWSQLFADLESSLPQQVRVSRITVRDISQTAGRTRADLELAVVGRSADDITRMMAQMAGARIFAADLLTQTPETRGGTGVEATLRVRYTPAPGRRAVTPEEESASAEPAGAAAAGVARAATSGGAR